MPVHCAIGRKLCRTPNPATSPFPMHCRFALQTDGMKQQSQPLSDISDTSGDDVGPSFAEHPLWWQPYGPYIRSATHNLKGRHRLQVQPHIFHELIALIKGRGHLTIKGQPTAIDGPAALLVAPGQAGECRLPPLAQWYSLRFTLTYRRRRPPSQLATQGRPPHTPLPTETDLYGCTLPALVPQHLTASCQAMIQTICSSWWRDPISYHRCNYRLGWWLLNYVEAIKGISPPSTQLQSRLRTAIREALPAGTQVQDVARSMGMSRQHLTRLLHDRDGSSVSEIIADERHHEACRLLACTDLAIIAIAFHCGFRDHSAFSRWFRQRTGASPRTWRQQHQGADTMDSVGQA